MRLVAGEASIVVALRAGARPGYLLGDALPE
jgi:hypothetical protein